MQGVSGRGGGALKFFWRELLRANSIDIIKNVFIRSCMVKEVMAG
jgi:hypothetical protein